MNRGRAGKAGARRGDRLHHHGRFADAKPRAAVGLRDADAEPAVIGQSAVKLLGKISVAIAFEPVIVGKARADFLDCGAHRLLQLSGGEIDGLAPAR